MNFVWFQISVNYNGKLKNNGESVDSNDGDAPFKFRLGITILHRIMVLPNKIYLFNMMFNIYGFLQVWEKLWRVGTLVLMVMTEIFVLTELLLHVSYCLVFIG